MRRFLVAALLSLVLGSQADAQIIRRNAPMYYYLSSNVVDVTYVTPSYVAPVVTAPSTAITPAGWTTTYTPTYSSWSPYFPVYSYTTYGYPTYYGRRWNRW